MVSRLSLVLLVLVIAAAIVGFTPGISSNVALVGKIVFFLLLLPLIISLFDVVGGRFRKGY